MRKYVVSNKNMVTKLKCIDCAHWKQTGEEPYQGDCMMYSVSCATAVMNKTTLPWFLKKEDAKVIREPIGSDVRKVKKNEIFMNDEEYVKAQKSRQEYVQYPDMRQLTDASKKLLRRGRKK